MFAELLTLGAPAVWIGFVHCICGPDHYVPFVAMSRVGLWSLRKTLLVTLVCGLGHVLSSVVIGFVGIGLGLILWQLEAHTLKNALGTAESVRGDIAGWLLLAFGIAYTAWGIYRALRPKTEAGSHVHSHIGHAHRHAHPHTTDSDGTAAKSNNQLTPWVLFTIFLFGPCEPLIPMLMVPASQKNMVGVIWITALFGITTLLTMTVLVALTYKGAFAIRFPKLETWGHALAGSIVAICGGAILFGL